MRSGRKTFTCPEYYSYLWVSFIKRESTVMRSPVSVLKRLAYTLYYLSDMGTLQKTANAFSCQDRVSQTLLSITVHRGPKYIRLHFTETWSWTLCLCLIVFLVFLVVLCFSSCVFPICVFKAGIWGTYPCFKNTDRRRQRAYPNFPAWRSFIVLPHEGVCKWSMQRSRTVL